MKTRYLGRQDYVPLWREMQKFTDERDESTPDEIWFCEHPPVFTLGLNASKEHLLAPDAPCPTGPEITLQSYYRSLGASAVAFAK